MTVLDLITEALQICGIVGDADPVSDARAQIGFKALVGLIDTANADPLKRFTRASATYAFVPGQQAYTIGPDASMNFNAARPTRVVAANCVDLTQPTYPARTPLAVLEFDEWARIRLQNSPTAIPWALYYDAGYTQIGTTTQGYGTISVHGVPNVANQLEIYTEQALTQASALTDTLIFPPGYYEWALYSLCARLYPRFQRSPDPTVIGLGLEAQRTIESANAVTPVLLLDSGLPGGRPAYFDARTNRQI